nr:MAG TPA: hypothetical protein [Caudoviricetes sp.]
MFEVFSVKLFFLKKLAFSKFSFYLCNVFKKQSTKTF